LSLFDSSVLPANAAALHLAPPVCRADSTVAVAHVQKRFAEDGFDPKKMVADLGIRADQGFYQKA
jgi:hypothetical protein